MRILFTANRSGSLRWRLIHEKTAGNPFFAIQFISALAEEALLTFDHGDGRWSWDLSRIQAKGYTDNVVELMIGKLNRLPVETQKAIFEIVNQLNRGTALITSQDERDQIAELNLIAGKRAKASTAHASALKYLIAGTALLEDDCWERRHELTFALELHRAECEFLTGEQVAAVERLSMLSSRAANTIEQATVACLRFGRLGYELVEKRGLERFKARTYLWFGQFVIPWTKHVRAGRDLMRRAFEAANKTGDLIVAAYSCAALNTNLLAAGDPLPEVQREAENGLEFAQKARFGLVIDCITPHLGIIRTLRGSTPKFGSFDHEGFDELVFEQNLESQPVLALNECRYWIRKLASPLRFRRLCFCRPCIIEGATAALDITITV